MTRLGRASVFLAVFAGGYAILMLINGQLTDFGVSAGVCAVALLGAALFAWRAGYGRAPAALPAGVVSTLEPHVSEEVLDSGIGDGPDRATGSGPDCDEWGYFDKLELDPKLKDSDYDLKKKPLPSLSR